MLLDRHRVAQLIELSRREQVLRGAERTQGEEDVALFLKTAYDDATKPARSEFMRRIGEKDWPWIAVASTAPVYALGHLQRSNASPPALALLLGQAETADADPSNRIPQRGTPAWEPLYQALDAWDTNTITRWIGPQGWVRVEADHNPELANGTPNGGELEAPSKPPFWQDPWTFVWVNLGIVFTTVVAGTSLAVYDEVKSARSRRRLEKRLKDVEDSP